MPLFHIAHGEQTPKQHPIGKDRVVMGRHPDCDVVLDLGAVSREHAQVTHADGQWFIEDLRSRNGTFVNGKQVSGRHQLSDLDQVRICDFLLTFQKGASNSGVNAPAGRDSAILVDDLGATQVISTQDTRTSAFSIGANPELKLKALLEITRNLVSALDLDKVLGKVLESLFNLFIQADRSFVVMWDEDRGTLIPRAVKHRRGDDHATARISRTIVNQVMESKEAILSADAATDMRFDASQSVADFRIRSMMCAPMVTSDGRALGVIQIDTLDQRSRFQQEDLEVLVSVASQAAAAVENAQLHQNALRQQALERDLNVAHKVQQGILPKEAPNLPGYEFFDFYESAQEVGGDYFDYVLLPNQRLGVVLADVSGKGIPAALVMAKLSSEARYCLLSEPDAAAALTRLNRDFSKGGWDDRFVTCIMLVIDLVKHEISFANAGHMSPMLRRTKGKITSIGDDITGVPLGVEPSTVYERFDLTLEPGDLLSVFTDGMTDAMNERSELYGAQRLHASLSRAATGVDQLGELVLEDVRRFVGNRSQTDDMCLLCFGRSK